MLKFGNDYTFTELVLNKEQQKEEDSYEHKLALWNQLNQGFEDAATRGDGQGVRDYTEQIKNMRNRGFVPPVAVKAVPANPSRVGNPVPVEQRIVKTVEESEYSKQKTIPCPICGVAVLPTQGYHKLPELGEGEICVIDAKRALASGVPRVRVEAALERQAVAAANKESN